MPSASDFITEENLNPRVSKPSRQDQVHS